MTGSLSSSLGAPAPSRHRRANAVNLADNPDGRNYIEYNEIRWVCEEIADTAAINCWMELGGPDEQRCGHVIRFNLISDIYGIEVKEGKIVRSQDFPTSGLYLDNCASNCLVFGNTFIRCGMAGVLVHNGRNNVIENNIFIDCGANVRFQDWIASLPYWGRMKGFMTGNVVERNICCQAQPGAAIYHLQGCHGWSTRSVARADDNVFWQPGGTYALRFTGELAEEVKLGDDEGEPVRAIETLGQWQTLGYDLNSAFQAPLFLDADNGDYRLKPDSPALKMGFQPIDIAGIGIRSQEKTQ